MQYIRYSQQINFNVVRNYHVHTRMTTRSSQLFWWIGWDPQIINNDCCFTGSTNVFSIIPSSVVWQWIICVSCSFKFTFTVHWLWGLFTPVIAYAISCIQLHVRISPLHFHDSFHAISCRFSTTLSSSCHSLISCESQHNWHQLYTFDCTSSSTHSLINSFTLSTNKFYIELYSSCCVFGHRKFLNGWDS